jgi:hypothetical protein
MNNDKMMQNMNMGSMNSMMSSGPSSMMSSGPNSMMSSGPNSMMSSGMNSQMNSMNMNQGMMGHINCVMSNIKRESRFILNINSPIIVPDHEHPLIFCLVIQRNAWAKS